MSMGWSRCIEINRRDLLPIVAGIVTMLGGGETVLRSVYLAVLAKLLLAEAILRRLITIAAKDMVVKPRARRTPPSGAIPKGEGDRVASFPLVDPRRYAGPPKEKTASGYGPNVRGLDGLDPPPPPAQSGVAPDDPVTADALRRRLDALIRAMEDIPAQARRLARRMAEAERPLRPLRPGRPPGHVARGRSPIDVLLADCHELALMALAGADAPP